MYTIQSTFADSAGRANTCTSTAVDAGISVDYVLAVTLRNCANRTLRLAGTTRYTGITNYICHDKYLLIFYTFLVYLFYRIYRKYSSGKCCAIGLKFVQSQLVSFNRLSLIPFTIIWRAASASSLPSGFTSFSG